MQIIDPASGEKTRKRLVNGILRQGRIGKNGQGETIKLRPQGVVGLGDPMGWLGVGYGQRTLLLEDRAPMMALLSKKQNRESGRHAPRAVARKHRRGSGTHHNSCFGAGDTQTRIATPVSVWRIPPHALARSVFVRLLS
jgi:hypothetical protein